MSPVRWMVVMLASAVLFVSALGAIWSKHQARVFFVDLQRLEKQRDQLDDEWGRLKLEQSAFAAHGRVEQVARADLKMSIPQPQAVNAVQVSITASANNLQRPTVRP